jgi:heme-degrading monooxygenase HmoA
MYAVIFRSVRKSDFDELYAEHSERMEKLVIQIPGYISHVSFRDQLTKEGVTVSYFDSLESIKAWREHPEHKATQELALTHFYESYEIKVAKIEREFSQSGL